MIRVSTGLLNKETFLLSVASASLACLTARGATSLPDAVCAVQRYSSCWCAE